MTTPTQNTTVESLLDKIGKQDEPYPVELQDETRADYVEQMLVKRREQIMEALEETRVTFEEAEELRGELGEIETELGSKGYREPNKWHEAGFGPAGIM